jgi:uncharacterized protein (DUF2336 family)
MIIRDFLRWMRTASATERADATHAVARGYLYSDLAPDDRAAAESALIMLLDDPSPKVREALARALAFSNASPPAVILGLATDQVEVASWVLEHSPLLVDADLVDAVATSGPAMQAAIARRAYLPASVSAAIAEVGAAEACLVLIENLQAAIAKFSLDRIIGRFGHLAAIREAMLSRDDLPAAAHQALLAKLSETLAGFVAGREWLEPDRAARVAKDACEKATIALAAASPASETGSLIRHLRQSGQLTAGLILRALLSGNVDMVEQALAELSGLPRKRVSALIRDYRSASLRALYERAGLPLSTYLAFCEALEAMRESGFVDGSGNSTRLRRRMVERVLARCGNESIDDVEPLLTLLRRFAAEAARDEARLLCREMERSEIDARPTPERIAA